MTNLVLTRQFIGYGLGLSDLQAIAYTGACVISGQTHGGYIIGSKAVQQR